MPPKKTTTRSSSTAARPSQGTISFGGKNRIVKSSAPKSRQPAPTTEPSEYDLPKKPTTEDVKPLKPVAPKVEEVVAEEATPPAPVQVSPEEKSAKRISDARIKQYWQGIEEQRRAPRIHQKGVTTNDRILRYFDISSQYGPSIGIQRQKRWYRAQALGLKPPIEVLAVILKEQRAENKKIERSHIEELMSSRFVTEGEA